MIKHKNTPSIKAKRPWPVYTSQGKTNTDTYETQPTLHGEEITR